MAASEPSIFDFWMRGGGASTQVFKLQTTDKLPAAERLLVSLLSRDKTLFRECAYLLKAHKDDFLQLTFKHSFANLVLDELTIRGASSIFKELNEHEYLVQVTDDLRRQCVAENLAYQRFDDRFTQFVARIVTLQDELIWLKGIVTSRTLFARSAMRLSTDFDFFVQPSKAQQLAETVRAMSYRRNWYDPAFCNQLEVGPTVTIDQSFITPAPDMVPSAVVGFEKDDWPTIDVKFNPLDRGLRMVELDRFISNAIWVKWNDIEFKAPDLLDQLIVTLTHYEKDRFESWKSLVDIGMLVDRINEHPLQWGEFKRRCKVEGVRTSCWAALSLAAERLSLANVGEILSALAPLPDQVARKFFYFTATPLFYWNTSSLPMLALNAAMADDSSRKFAALKKCVLPSQEFLSQYYAEGKSLSLANRVLAIFLHWSVLFLPGGIVRRTFGRFLWPNARVRSMREERKGKN